MWLWVLKETRETDALGEVNLSTCLAGSPSSTLEERP